MSGFVLHARIFSWVLGAQRGNGGVFWPPHRCSRKRGCSQSVDMALHSSCSGCGVSQPFSWRECRSLSATGKHFCSTSEKTHFKKYLIVVLVHVQGEHVESCHVERPHQPTVLHWHPLKPVLALGWENGEVVLLMHPSGDQTVLPSLHTASITLLEWSSSGSRLVTGDQVFSWKKTTTWNSKIQLTCPFDYLTAN